MKLNKEVIMQARAFIEKLQNIYGNHYNNDQIEVIVNKTKNYTKAALDHAVNSLIEKYKTLPSVPNVLEYCEKGGIQHPYVFINKQNNLTAESFGVSQPVYNGWFSELKIDLNGYKCVITPRNEKSNGMPSKIFETHIMTHLKKNLLNIISDDVEVIEWNYLGFYKNSLYYKSSDFE